MAKKYPSNKTTTFDKFSFEKQFGTLKTVGKSNNQLSPHKRWRQTFKLKYPKTEKLVSVEFKDDLGGHVGGPIMTFSDFKKQINDIRKDPNYLGYSIFNNKTTKELNQSTYKIDQGITLAYELYYDIEASK